MVIAGNGTSPSMTSLMEKLICSSQSLITEIVALWRKKAQSRTKATFWKAKQKTLLEAISETAESSSTWGLN